nr:unnamed protein product [Callosobruchus analis]
MHPFYGLLSGDIHTFGSTVRQTGFQHHWAINVWVGILPRRLNGAAYLEPINQHIVDIIDSVPLAFLRTM